MRNAKFTRDSLMRLPVRAWNKRHDSEYDSVLVIGTGAAHGSGCGIMAIIGVRGRHPVEIASAYCDDIIWVIPHHLQMRTECALRSGALHMRSPNARFRVGLELSSTEIELVAARIQTAR